jgi:ketosteroid isomerase-like protein
MSQENVVIVRSVLAALNQGDFEAAFKDAAAGAEADLSRYGIEEVIDAGDYVVTPFANRVAGRDGIEVLAHGTWLWEIRGGAILRLCLYQTRQEALEAVGLTE